MSDLVGQDAGTHEVLTCWQMVDGEDNLDFDPSSKNI